MVDFNGVKLVNDPSMIQILMNFVLPDSMFDIIIFYLLWPAVVEMMDFARNFSTVI